MSVAAEATGRLEALFAERTGIDLGRGLKGPQLERFVSARALELGFRNLDDYVDTLVRGGHAELDRLVNAATVGLTWFFRDPDQLAAIAQIFAENAGKRPLDIWVAGCATGEDVYSLAMIANGMGQPVSILGTDINSDFLAHAGQGIYSAWACRNVAPEHARHLLPTSDGRLSATPALRRDVRFARHNLVDSPPGSPTGGWDLILCRNVLIYFYPQQATLTVTRLARALGPRGWLFLGANEMIQSESPLVHVAAIGGRYGLRRGSASEAPPRMTFAAPVPTPATASAAPTLPAPPRSVPALLEPAELLKRANDRHASGALADALQLYAQVLALDPLCTEARMFLGIVHYKTGDPSSAAVALRAAIFLEPELWPAAFYLALSYDKLGHHADAEREYRRVVASAGHRLSITGVMIAQLETWKEEVVHLARERAGARAQDPRRR